jgi:hypothetical protein
LAVRPPGSVRRAAGPRVCRLPLEGDGFELPVRERRAMAPSHGLFHHLIGGGEDRLWDRQAEQPGGLLVNHQFKPPGLLDRQIDWLCALDDLSGIHCSLAPNCSSARAARGVDMVVSGTKRRQGPLRRSLAEPTGRGSTVTSAWVRPMRSRRTSSRLASNTSLSGTHRSRRSSACWRQRRTTTALSA